MEVKLASAIAKLICVFCFGVLLHICALCWHSFCVIVALYLHHACYIFGLVLHYIGNNCASFLRFIDIIFVSILHHFEMMLQFVHFLSISDVGLIFGVLGYL